MKKLLDLGSNSVIIASITIFLVFFNLSEFEKPPMQVPELLPVEFNYKDFPVDSIRIIEFDLSAENFDRLTKREKIDQVKDWLLITVVTSSGISTDRISQSLFDLPVLRYRYMQSIANFEYGNTRSVYIGDGKVIALIPSDCSREQKIDCLAHISDKHRKDLGELPGSLIVFEYQIDLNEHFASVVRRENMPVYGLYLEATGYFISEIKSLDDLEIFMDNIEDVTYAEIKYDCLVLGGRKLQSRNYRGVRVEDIAAIWQSENKIQKKLEDFNRKWRNVTYTYEYEKTLLEKEMQDEMERLHLVEGSGFSLDPKYDFKGLLVYFEKLEDKLSLFLSLNTNKTDKEIVGIIMDVRNGLINKNIVPYLKLVENTKDSPSLSLVNFFLKSGMYMYEFQSARYDGYLEGTEAGMVLFYTDLLAKLWALDYMNNTPDRYIEDFCALIHVPVSTIYQKESEELPNTRLWFGHQNKGFQVVGKDDTLLFARNATRVYAASSNPLRPGEETEPAAESQAFLGWWNNHYEEIARYEPEYERLNEIMKWSIIISWLNESNHGHLLSNLQSVNVDHSKWFPNWVKKQKRLRYKNWKKIGFFNRGAYNSKTETMPILSSETYRLFNKEWHLEGGVSLASKKLFRGRYALSKDMPKLVRRSNIKYNLYNNDLKDISTFDGMTYKIESLGSNKVSVISQAKNGAKLRGLTTELKNLEFEKTFIKNQKNIHIRSNFNSNEIGNLEINKTRSKYKLNWKTGDVDRGHMIAKELSSKSNLEEYLVDNPNIRSFIKNQDRGYYLIELRNGKRWIKIAREESPTKDISIGWLSRVSDPQKGVQNLDLGWVDGEIALKELGNKNNLIYDLQVTGQKALKANLTNEQINSIKRMADFRNNLANDNYQVIAKNITENPVTFKLLVNECRTNNEIFIDRLIKNGNFDKASRELDNLVDKFGNSVKLAERKNIIEINQRIKRINDVNDECMVFTVEDHSSHYMIYDGNGFEIYKGNNFADISNSINSNLNKSCNTVYLDMKNLSKPKIDAFESSLRIQQNRLNKDISVKNLARYNKSTAIQDMFLNKGIRKIKPLKSELVMSGKFKGWQKITLEGIKSIRGFSQKIKIIIYAKTRALADQFILLFNRQYSKLKLTPTKLSSKSPADIINRVRFDLKKKYNLNENELIIEFEDQLGNTQIVCIKRGGFKYIG